MFLTGVFNKIFTPIAHAIGVIPVVEDGSGNAHNLAGNDRGAALVEDDHGIDSALTALSDGAVLSAAPVKYKAIRVHVDAGAAGWVQLHNLAAEPLDGVVPVDIRYVTGPGGAEFLQREFSVGCYWCLSSTMRTKTKTATTLACASVEV